MPAWIIFPLVDLFRPLRTPQDQQNGQLRIEGEYLNSKKNGLWTTYYSDGQERKIGFYKYSKKDGEWKYYNRKGELISTVTYKDGKDVKELEAFKK